VKRSWIVPVAQRLPDGQVVVDTEAAAAALLELQGPLQRLGGTVAIASVRDEVTPGRVETVALQFNFDTYVPMEQRPTERAGQQPKAETPPPPKPQPVPDPEPEAPEPDERPAQNVSEREERVRAGSV
jgi:hypothetical protein